MSKNLHAKAFDEDTITKLEIFESYAKEWIPTFLKQSHINKICIFDFFAGTGYDLDGKEGSSIRILKQLNSHLGNIKNKKVIVYLNEFDLDKFKQLKQACSDYLNNNQELNKVVVIKYYNQDFDSLFFQLLSDIRKHPSLVYLDQNGIKFISDKYLLALEQSPTTDFLYFIASSYFLRFSKKEEFKSHVDIDISAAKGNHKAIHRVVTEELRKKLPSHTKLRLYPFSIEKKSNIYGIIFGASHLRAVDKFLHLAWKKNSINGEANFDIDDDATKVIQSDIFEGKRLTKIEHFKEAVELKILNKGITNNFELYYFTLEQGHIPNHAAECLKKMKEDGKITYDNRSPLVTYDNVFKHKKKIEYQVLIQ